MVLKKLVMKGFKSFPDKTEIKFERGITAIVGPNGSGKSNIVDAIRWVFGEQSAKTLRGGKMDDVIFGGSKDRGPQSYAEVTLVVDNSDGTLSVEYDEVAITRRIYRSGEGEYFLNQSAVRLKDIVELFMNTGLGRDGYSIISQGRITEIVTQKGQDRRGIFEEAAGIAKYRYRKEESQKKLRGTEENLVRLRDIQGELESRVEPLRAQSEKARKYLALYDEKKNLDINLWIYDLNKIKEETARMRDATFLAQTSLEAAERDISAEEVRIERYLQAAQQKNVEIEGTLTKIRELEQKNSELLSQTAVLDNEIKHFEEQAVRLEESLAQSSKLEGELDAEKASKLERKQALEERKAREEEALAELGDRTKHAASGAEGLAGRIEELRTQLAACQGQITDLKISLSSKTAEKTAHENRARELLEQALARGQEEEEQAARQQELQRQAEACDRAIASCGNILAGYRKKLDTKRGRVDEQQEQLKKLETELAGKRQRRNTLTEMEKQMDGYSGSVKRVMQEAKRGILRGVCGPVSMLLRTEDAYAVAIETALGFAMQNVVVETENDAKNAIALLKREGAGRATFMPVSAVRGGLLQERDLKRFDGFVGLAVNLVKTDSKYQNIMENLLGRVAVATDLDGAAEIAKSCGYRFRIVTLDGQVINAGGSFTGGSLAKNTGFLSRTVLIEKLTAEIGALEERCRAREGEVGAALRELAVLESELAAEEGRRESEEKKKLAVGQELSGVVLLLRSAAEARERLEAERANCQALCETLAGEIARAEEALAGQEAELTGYTGELERLTEHQKSEREKSERLMEQVAAARISISELGKDIEAVLAALQDLEARRAAFRLEARTRAEEIGTFRTRAQELRETRARSMADQEARRAEIASLQETRGRMGAERDQFDKDAADSRRALKEKNAHKEQLIKEYERLSTRESGLQSDYDGLISKLYDEYELTYTEAVSLQDPQFDHGAFARQAAQVRRELKELGNVNVDAIEEYRQVKERYDFYRTQIRDLEESRASLEDFIREITAQMQDIFSQNFQIINQKFQEVFQELFGGGTACLELSDPSDVLESGIEIKAAPPGKIIKNLTVLSGGEQAFVAIALYFGIMGVRPPAFCVLDEIEAALDEVNVARFAAFLRNYTKTTQFIVITHRRGTMEAADMLYGVTMQQRGISRMLGLNVSEVEKKLKIKL